MQIRLDAYSAGAAVATDLVNTGPEVYDQHRGGAARPGGAAEVPGRA